MRRKFTLFALAGALALAGCADDTSRERDTTAPVVSPSSAPATSPATTPEPSADPTTDSEPSADPSDGRALLELSADFLEGATAVNIEMTLDQDLDLGGTAMTVTSSMSGPQTIDPFQADIVTSATAGGTATESRMVVVTEGTEMTLYALGPAGWVQAPMTPEDASRLGLDAGFTDLASLLRSLPESTQITTTPGTSPAGTPATVVTVPLDSAAIEQMSQSSPAGMSLDGNGTMVLTIDPATGELFSNTMNMQLTNVGGAGSIDQDVSVIYKDWNVMPTITVPPEALNAPVDESILGVF